MLLINNGWTITTAICTLLFTIFHFPCGTTCLTIKKETGSLKTSIEYLSKILDVKHKVLPLAARLLLLRRLLSAMYLIPISKPEGNMKERIQTLTKQLNEANYRYYVLDDPQMPDFEYDRLLRELEELEAQRVELLRSIKAGEQQCYKQQHNYDLFD